jgi:hypothetical protein
MKWRCAKGFSDGSFSQCSCGICLKHGRQLIASNDKVLLEAGNKEITVITDSVDNDDVQNITNDTEDQHQNITNDEDDPLLDVFINIDDGEEGMFAPTNYEYVGIDGSVSGHTMLNGAFGMMRRKRHGRNYSKVNKILQNVMALSPSTSVPVVYPEAVLFPTIFWASVDDSVIGALPSFLYSMHSTKKWKNIASLSDHLQVRLYDLDLLTAHRQDYFHFVFNTILNERLIGVSPYMVAKKGVEVLDETVVRKQEGSMVFEDFDCTNRVQELAAMHREMTWTMFHTLTANDEGTPGLEELTESIKNACNGKYDPQIVRVDMIPRKISELGLHLRIWERFVRRYVDWILHSEDEPVGPVKYVWMRYEWQTSGGSAKPHVHMGICLNEDKKKAAERVCGDIDWMFEDRFKTTENELLQKGLIKDEDDFIKLIKMARSFQIHSCKQSRGRCAQRYDKNGKPICRLGISSTGEENTYEKFLHYYNKEDEEIFKSIGLADEYGNVQEELCGGKWNFKKNSLDNFIPTVPILFAVSRSCSNVRLCDDRFAHAYLSKYAAGKESRPEYNLFPASKDWEHPEEWIVEERQQVNQKLRASIAKEAMRKATEKNDQMVTRMMCLTELLWYSMNLPYIYTNIDFIHVPTGTPETRSAILKSRPMSTNITGFAGEEHTNVSKRRHLPQWRQFTKAQREQLEEYTASKYTLDKITAFSLRPPELRFINTVEHYYKFLTLREEIKYR